MKIPSISVIIPAYNEERDIGKCLSSLQNQSYPKGKTEIIVVDDGSRDNTRAVIQAFKGIKLINGEHKGPGISRNIGARHARGEILIFVDADMTFDKNYIQNLIKPIIEGKEKQTEDGVQIASNPNNIWSKCWGQYFKLDPKRDYGSTTRAIKRKLFLELGGFDPKYGYMDDKTIFLKYGIQSFWVKDAICYHANPSTLREVYKQSKWIGSSLKNTFLTIPILKYLAPLLLFVLFPIAISLISIKKSIKLNNFKILFPWMFIFMSARYLGTIAGITQKLFLNRNIR